MSSIDERIVRMKFDNQGFESGVETTMGTLEKLKNALKFEKVSEGASKISEGLQKLKTIGIGELNSGVDSASVKFSTLGVIGTTALANITNSAVNAGKRLASAFTIDPVKTGFSEYETKMNAISTILANTADDGETLESVGAALNELNKYADDTIYNFAQMTENIGRFTAAGVSLKDSVASIKGLSNLAAFFGVDPVKASGAMYQMSQAISAGKIQLMDWNSLVNAGMSGKAFQDALVRTSEVMGTGAEAAIKKYGSFRESLTKGAWLTSDVMVETLKQISGAYKESELRAQGYSATQAKAIADMAKQANKSATEVRTITGMIDAMKESVQSGWAISWEHIIGDKEEATKLLTGIKDAFEGVINPISDARNEMLEFWNENGGRDAVIKGLSNVFQGLGKGLGVVRDAFREVFPPMTGQKLVEMSKGFLELTKNFKMSDETANKIKSTFKGLFTVIEFGKNIVSVLFSAFGSAMGVVGGLANVFLTLTSSVADFVASIGEAINESKMFEKVSSAIDTAFSSLENVFEGLGNFIQSVFDSLGKVDLTGFFSGIGDAAGFIAQGFKSVFDGIGKAIGNFNLNGLMTLLQATLTGGVIKAMRDLFANIRDSFDNVADSLGAFKDVAGTVKDTLGEVKNTLVAYQTDLEANKLVKIAGAIALLAASLVMIASIDSEAMGSALSSIMILMGALTLMMKVITGMELKGISKGKGLVGFFAGFSMLKQMGLAALLLGVATSILILSTALKSISELDWDEIGRGLTGVAGLLLILVAASKLMNAQTKGLISTSAGLIVLSVAIRMLVDVVKEFGELNPENLFKGLIGLGVLMSELALFSDLLKNGKNMISQATGLMILAVAINTFAVAVKSFANMDTNGLIQGLAAVGAVLLELAVFMKLTSKSPMMVASAVAITILAVALNILAGAVRSFASMNYEQLATGLLGLAGALLVVAVAADTMKSAKLAASAVGVALMGTSLSILVEAVKAFGSVPLEQLAIGILAMSASLLVLAVAMSAMSTGLAGAAAMLVMSAALALFVPQLIALGSVDPANIAIGLMGMAAAFLVLGGAGTLLAPVIPAILALSGAILVLGAGAALAGAGLALFAAALTTIAGVGAAAGFALVEMLRQLIGLIPQAAAALGEGFVNLLLVIGQSVPQLVDTFGNAVIAIINKLIELLPQIFTLGVELIGTLCMAIATCIPQIVQTGIDVVLALINGLAQNVGAIIQAGVDLINALAEGIRSNGPAVIDAIQNLLMSLLELIWAGAGDFLKGAWEWIKSMASGIAQKAGEVDAKVNKIITDAVMKVAGAVGKFLKAGIDWIVNLIRGINQTATQVFTKMSQLVSNAVKAVGSKVSEFVTAGANMIGGLITGIGQKARELAQKAADAAESALDAARSALGIHSPSREFMKVGRYSMEGMVVGIDRYAHKVENSASSMANNVLNTVSRSLANMSSIVDGNMDVNPTIKPVMDLSNVEQGSRRIGDLLNSNEYALSASTSGLLSRTVGEIQNGNDNSDIISALKDLKGAISDVGGTTYRIDGITYDDGSNIANTVESLVRAAKIERRI